MADIKSRVEQAIAAGAANGVGLDPAELEIVACDGGVVQLRFAGWCAGCPSTVMAIIQSLEHELRKRVPEVEYIEVVP